MLNEQFPRLRVVRANGALPNASPLRRSLRPLRRRANRFQRLLRGYGGSRSAGTRAGSRQYPKIGADEQQRTRDQGRLYLQEGQGLAGRPELCHHGRRRIWRSRTENSRAEAAGNHDEPTELVERISGRDGKISLCLQLAECQRNKSLLLLSRRRFIRGPIHDGGVLERRRWLSAEHLLAEGPQRQDQAGTNI